jgi:IS30 family transposase
MTKNKTFRHLVEHDRDRIHALYLYGYKQKDIAEVLGVNPGTISRELSRYGRKTWRYSAIQAQKDADYKRTLSKCPGMKIESNQELKKYIIQELEKLRSPDEIAGRMKRENLLPRIGTNAIYKWIYSPFGTSYRKYLCMRRKRKKKQSRLSKRELIPDRISFRHKPNEPGMVHAAGDLFVSPYHTHDKTSGLLIVVPEMHLLSGELIPNKTKSVVVPAVKHHAKTLSLDTCTFDNGIENVHHREFGVDSYFCDRGSPWQKPHVESSIGLIRRWFLPKGTILSSITNKSFQSQLHLLNHKYRKSLGYRSAYEVAMERGIIKEVPSISLSEAIAFR